MEDIRAFFESYRARWEATRDGKVIAKFYHAPSLTLRGDGSFECFQTTDDVARFFHATADTYHRQGLNRIAFKDFSASPLGARSAFATMTWQAFKADGSLAREWRQSYNLVRFGDAWEIVLSTFHVDR